MRRHFILSGCIAMAACTGLPSGSLLAQAGKRELYFTHRGERVEGTSPLRFRTTDYISLELELRLPSLEDRSTRLVIDDYRYEEPNYFTDKRVPNVRFEVTKVRGRARRPTSYRVASQGSGGDVEREHTNVWFQLGRSRAVYRLRDWLGYLGLFLAPHARGTYQIRAFYEGLVTPAIAVAVE
jgi:hypothetical protein